MIHNDYDENRFFDNEDNQRQQGEGMKRVFVYMVAAVFYDFLRNRGSCPGEEGGSGCIEKGRLQYPETEDGKGRVLPRLPPSKLST